MAEHNVGFEGKRRLKQAPGEIRQILDRMVREGEILAVILENEEGIGVQVFGEPSQKMLMALETTVEAYREALRQFVQ